MCNRKGKMKPNWDKIMSDSTLSRLAKRINKRYPFMSEEDIQYLFDVFYDANKIMLNKGK